MSQSAETSCARILLVDDHPLYRNGLRQLLSGHDGFAVCGEAGTLADARRLCDEFTPGLVTLDLVMPDGQGLDFLRESREWAKPPSVLIITMKKADDPIALDAMRIGAAGFLCKESSPDDVVEAVTQICSGRTHLSPELVAQLIQRRR